MTHPVHPARAVSFPAEADTLPAMFAQQAAFTPDLPAVVTPHEALSFAELDRLSRRIAGALLRLPEAGPVILLLRESPLLFAMMLGAAHAGRIFIPLEITWAASWMARVVASSGAAFVIADENGRELAERITGEHARFLDADALAQSYAPPLSVVLPSPKNIVCVIYTSGSTGQPKGVALDHAFLLHRAAARQRVYRFAPGSRLGHLRSSSYSAGLNVSLTALLNGAGVYVFNLRREGVHRLAPWLNAHHITHVSFTSSLFRSWLAVLPENFRFPHIRMVAAIAEPLYGSDLIRIKRHLSGDWRLVHSLSSTETGVLTHAIFGPSSPTPEVVPVGIVIDGAEIRVEDHTGQAVAAGEAGEIIVRARHLAQGYWNDPETTAQRFSTEPNGCRVYRTQDRGRFMPDGNLEHLGRKDRKIKLRGYSVEPHEIECALLRLADVRDAAVVVEGERDAATLYAFVSGPKDYSPEVGQGLRRALAADLPSHLVPARITVLPSLPLTSRGKIDRNLLLKRVPRRTSAPSRPPSDEIERMLLDVWGKTLRRRDFGVDDDIHDLGASSLQVFAVFSWLDALGWTLPPSTIFEAPSIARQAELLRRNPHFRGAAGRIVPLRETGARRPIFFLHARKGDILYARELYPLMNKDRPIYSIRASFLDGRERIPRTVTSMAAAYLVDIKRVQPQGPYNICGYSFGGTVAFEMARMLRAAGEEVAFLGLIDTHMQPKARYVPSGPLSPRGYKKVVAYLWSLGVAIYYWQDEIRMFLKRPVPHERRLAYYSYIYMRASRRYRHKPYDGDAVMFGGAGLVEQHRSSWSSVIQGHLEVVELPGGHSDIIWPPLNGMLAEALDAQLDVVEARRSGALAATPDIPAAM